MKNVFLLIVIIGGLLKINAQNNILHSGPDGVYIFLGIESAEFNISKKGDGDFEKLTSITSPVSKEVFILRLKNSLIERHEENRFSAIPIDKIWQQFEKYHRLDSLYFYGNNIAVQVALGFAYFDPAVSAGKSYQYKIEAALKGYPILSDPFVYKYVVPDIPLQFQTTEIYNFQPLLSYNVGKELPDWIAVYRRDDESGIFKEIQVSILTAVEDGKTIISIKDTSALPFVLYDYYLVPHDLYANAGSASDTIRIGNYSISDLYAPHLKAIALEDGIAVNWLVRQPWLIKNVSLYRSESFEDDFKFITDLGPYDTLYIDNFIKPFTTYFYRMVLHGFNGDTSIPSSKVFAFYKNLDTPIAPVLQAAQSVSTGVLLVWNKPQNNLDGYYVFRKSPEDTNWLQITELIRDEKIEIQYTDSSQVLTGNTYYEYAVVAVGNNHVNSELSNIVIGRPGIKTHPPAPISVTSKVVNTAVEIMWQDMHAVEETVIGYIVLRRTNDTFILLNSSVLSFDENHFTDTTAQAGKVYEYCVQSIDRFGGESTLSGITTAVIPIKNEKVIAPAQAIVKKTAQGFLIEWSAVYQSNLVGYNIYRTDSKGKKTKIGNVSSDITKFIDVKATKTNSYTFSITCVLADNTESEDAVIAKVIN